MRGMVAEQLLASWNTTPNHAAITDFVATVTTEGGEGFVLPAERVAVFDNDGTLWSEKPIPIQLDFTLYRMAEQAESDRSLRDRQPYKAAVERDYNWLGAAMVKHYRGDDADMHTLLGAVERAFEGMTVDAFGAEVLTWFETAEHPVLKQHDDADREFAYDDGAEDALARAHDKGWNVVSVRDDWSTVFG